MADKLKIVFIAAILLCNTAIGQMKGELNFLVSRVESYVSPQNGMNYEIECQANSLKSWGPSLAVSLLALNQRFYLDELYRHLYYSSHVGLYKQFAIEKVKIKLLGQIGFYNLMRYEDTPIDNSGSLFSSWYIPVRVFFDYKVGVQLKYEIYERINVIGGYKQHFGIGENKKILDNNFQLTVGLGLQFN